MAISFILIITVIPKDHQVCSHYLPKEEAGGMGFQLPEKKKNTKLNGLKHLFSHKLAMWAGLDEDGISLPHLKSVGQLKILQVEGTKVLLGLLSGA